MIYDHTDKSSAIILIGMKIKKQQVNVPKEETILKAAKALFLKHGYSETTMDAIALRARITKQTVYSYYENKEILFTAMIRSLCERKTAPDSARAGQSESFEALFTTTGLKLLDLITSPEVLSTTRLVIAESDRYPKLATLYYEKGTQELVHVLAEVLD